MWTVVLLLVFLPDLVPEPVSVPAGCEFSFPPQDPKCTERPVFVIISVEILTGSLGLWPKPSDSDGSLTWRMGLRTGVNTAKELSGKPVSRSHHAGTPGAGRQSLGRASSRRRWPFAGR